MGHPLTDAEVRRHHWRWFALALVQLGAAVLVFALCLAVVLEVGPEPFDIVLLTALVALIEFSLRVATRRWRRLGFAVA